MCTHTQTFSPRTHVRPHTGVLQRARRLSGRKCVRQQRNRLAHACATAPQHRHPSLRGPFKQQLVAPLYVYAVTESTLVKKRFHSLLSPPR
jgi:hypothetical protein